MDLAALMVRIGADTSGLDRGLSRADRGIGQLTNNATRMGRVFATATGAIAGAFAGIKLGGLVKDAAMLTSRYETLGVVMGVVGRNAGYSGSQMAAFEADLRRTGIAANETRGTLASMIQAQIDLARSTELARLAQDAAVIAQTNSSEAFERLIYGIQSGQTQILRTMGLNVSFEASYRKLAQQLGKSTNQLTEQEKVQARTNAVMASGARIAGTYEASMGTAGKQLGSLNRMHKDLGNTIGGVFSASMRSMVFGYSEGLSRVQKALNGISQAQITQWGERLARALREGAAAATALAAVMGTRLAASFALSTAAKVKSEVASYRKVRADLAAARAAQSAAQAEFGMARAMGASSAAMQFRAQSAQRLGAANVALTAATARASIAGRVFSGMLGMLGGPIGATITLLGGLSYAFWRLGQRAKDAAREVKTAVDDFRSELADLSEFEVKVRVAGVEAEIASIEADLRRTPRTIERQVNTMSGTQTISRANEAWTALNNRLEENRGKLAAAERHLERIAELSAATNEDTPGGDPSEMMKGLKDRASALITTYEALKARGEDYAGVMQKILGLQRQVEGVIRSQGDATTTLRAEALSLSGELSQAVAGAIDFSALSARLEEEVRDIARGIEANPLRIAVVTNLAEQLQAEADRMRPIMLQIPGRDPNRMRTGAGGVVLNRRDSVSGILDARARRYGTEGFGAGLAGPKVPAKPSKGLFGGLMDGVSQAADALKAKLTPAVLAGGAVFALLAPIAKGMAEALGPAIQALTTPLVMVGQVIGGLIVPVLRLLFDPLKLFGVVIAMLGETIARVAGWTFDFIAGMKQALGSFVSAIGSVIRKIPGLGRVGRALQDYGNHLQEGAERHKQNAAAARRTAEEMEETQRELMGLKWDDLIEGADKAAASLQNLPEVFDYVGRRLQASRVGASAVTPSALPPAGDGAGSGGGDVTVNVINPPPGVDSERIAQDVRRLLIDELRGYRGDGELRYLIGAPV